MLSTHSFALVHKIRSFRPTLQCNRINRRYCQEHGSKDGSRSNEIQSASVPISANPSSTSTAQNVENTLDASNTKPKSVREMEKELPAHLRERRRKRDHIFKGFTDTVRIAVINNTKSVAEAKKRHSMSDAATRLVGRAMAAASLLAGWQYGEERVILTFEGSGPMDTITAEAIRSGEIRAYTTNPTFIMPVGTPLGFALGPGSLKVTKILYNEAKPYHSVVPLARADISSDVEMFYKLSEQIPAHVELETHVNYLGEVTFSGGLIIEALPPKETHLSNKDYVKPYQDRLLGLPPLSVLFGEDAHSLKEVIHKIAPGEVPEEHCEKIVTDFHCRCSKEKFTKNLTTLGPDGLREFFALAGEEKTLKCQYCSTTYYLTDNDMRQLMDNMLEQRKEAKLKKNSNLQGLERDSTPPKKE